MTAFLALFRKDVLLFLTNRRALVMSFIAPIIMASFFGYVFGNRPGETTEVDVGYVDEDGSAVSESLAKKLDGDEAVALRRLSKEDAEKLVRTGEMSAAVVIPKGFGEQASRGVFRQSAEKPAVEILFDPSKTIERQMVQGLLMGHTMEAVSEAAFTGESSTRLADELIGEIDRSDNPGPIARDLRALLENAKRLNVSTGGVGPGLTVPFSTTTRAMSKSGGENMTGHYFSGMGVQFILFLGIEGGAALLLQRQRGLWKRFRTAPVSRHTLIAARAASSALFSLAVIAVMFAVARVVFDVRVEGSLPGFALVSLAIAAMTAAYGLCIAALGNTPEGARPIATLVTLVLVMLGGAWIPSFLFPKWLQTATLITPTRWAVDGLDAMTWRGLGFSEALPAAGVILLWTGLLVSVAMARFRWEE